MNSSLSALHFLPHRGPEKTPEFSLELRRFRFRSSVITVQSLRDRLSLLVSEAGSWKAEYWSGIPSTEIFVQGNLMCPENFRVSPPSCFHLPKPKETTYRATTVSLCFFLHLLVALRLRSLRFHSPRLCRVAGFLIQPNVSLTSSPAQDLALANMASLPPLPLYGQKQCEPCPGLYVSDSVLSPRDRCAGKRRFTR